MDINSLNKSIEQRKAHIFRPVEGHFAHDTSTNRQLLIDTVLNPDNYIGRDKWGNDWYAKTGYNYTQIWVQIRKGKIINGGLNLTPRPWNSSTGFSRITPP